jgi:hypothetical protein
MDIGEARVVAHDYLSGRNLLIGPRLYQAIECLIQNASILVASSREAVERYNNYLEPVVDLRKLDRGSHSQLNLSKSDHILCDRTPT